MLSDKVVIKLGKRKPSGAFRLSDDALRRTCGLRSEMIRPTDNKAVDLSTRVPSGALKMSKRTVEQLCTQRSAMTRLPRQPRKKRR